MARIRTIKPEFWVSEQVVECSTTARLLFIGLWNFCDDAGIHSASPRSLKMEVFPGDDFTADDVQKLVDELIAAGLLVFYEVGGKGYWKVTGWHHQKIEKPTKKHPEPQDSTTSLQSFDNHSATTRRPFYESSTTEGSLMESNGEEIDASASVPPPPAHTDNPKPDNPKTGNPKRGTRLPTDWTLPTEWAEWAVAERPGYPVIAESAKFRDYWVAKTGSAATKLDWAATWRNWVRNSTLPPLRANPAQPSTTQTAPTNHYREYRPT